MLSTKAVAAVTARRQPDAAGRSPHHASRTPARAKTRVVAAPGSGLRSSHQMFSSKPGVRSSPIRLRREKRPKKSATPRAASRGHSRIPPTACARSRARLGRTTRGGSSSALSCGQASSRRRHYSTHAPSARCGGAGLASASMLAGMRPASGIPDPTARGLVAAADLAGRVAGEVRTSPLTRWLYSTDASIYRVIPDAVLVARPVADLAAAAEVAARHDVPLCVRGAATSLAGQTLGAGIAVDCFHLDRILEIDPERRLARVEPGVVQGALNRAAAPYGLEFGPDTSTVEQATIGGMAGNNSSGSRSIVYGATKDK